MLKFVFVSNIREHQVNNLFQHNEREYSKLFNDWSRKPEKCYEQYDWHMIHFHNPLKGRTNDTKCFHSRERKQAGVFEHPAIRADATLLV